LGEVKKKKATDQQHEHLGEVDGNFLPAGFVQGYSHQGVEIGPMNSLQYQVLITGELTKNINKLPEAISSTSFQKSFAFNQQLQSYFKGLQSFTTSAATSKLLYSAPSSEQPK